MNTNPFIKISLNEEDSSLISNHYINEVLPTTKQFKEFHMNRLLALVEGSKETLPLARRFAATKKETKERTFEDTLIRPILESLGNTVKPQVGLNEDTVDFCVYQPDSAIEPDGFATNYTNTTAIIEAKKYGRIENKYFVRKKDNTDEVYQTLNYLRTMNLVLNHNKSSHQVPFIILTDGYRWRIYSKNYVHNIKEYESHFIEFDLEAIVNCQDINTRNKYLKLFGIFLSKESLAGELLKHQRKSSELEVAVTTGLREQTYTALEYIATGIWRAIMHGNPLFRYVLKDAYKIDVTKAKEEEAERAKLLKIIYEESVVYLLRLLFVLYAEDRNLFDQKQIPKVIKGENNILELITAKGKGIGEINDNDRLKDNVDVALADIFDAIDKQYNGGLFSKDKHPLLYKLDMEDTLFANAIDNLCRVQVGKKIYTVDFSTISVRELGGIHESLLEYKLAVVDEDMEELPSIINKKRVRHNVSKGDLYLINHNGERKSTGSYYTPDLIVEHLVQTALEPKLEEAKKIGNGDLDKLFKAVLDIKICDPSMGSGHMILAAYSRILSFVHQCIEEFHNEGKTPIEWNNQIEYNIRTQIARRCIYGVDYNPMAVELAKLVLWMKVFRPDRPFEFFDYNLAYGNSLIGVYDEKKAEYSPEGYALFRSQEQVEADIQGRLLDAVDHMMRMPRNTTQEVHQVEQYWHNKVAPLQHEVSFFYNIKLAEWLLPKKKKEIQETYDELIQGIDQDINYVNELLQGNPHIPENIRKLAEIDQEIRETYHPLHWKVAFPHIAVKGGFSVILSNPPWDKIKPNHREFFIDYIDNYKDMETTPAKKAAKNYMENHPLIAKKWNEYQSNIELVNKYYSNAYKYQIWRGKDKKTYKGDANLYKVFLEKIYTILAQEGICGIVIPDNLNIDNGCTGLRNLLLDYSEIKELIMFENRKKLFDIDSRYKFNVLTFVKKVPRSNAAFDAGFYWYDPIWLDGTPDDEYIAQNEKNQKKHHIRYRYSVPFIKKSNPQTYEIFEFKSKALMDIFDKIFQYPTIGDCTQSMFIKTFREFDMTFDSDLFNLDGKGWPLFQGKTIHHYTDHLNPIERYVISDDGEERLAKRWKLNKKDLPDRHYRIGWRDIAQPTDTRSLISTVIPRGVFCGNAINQALIVENGNTITNPEIIAGINVILSSFIADLYIRQRIAKHVNAFILKSMPVPRNIQIIEKLGKMALPLFDGDEYDAFRENVTPLTDSAAREKLIAKLDARVAILYGLTYEEYQTVLDTFPLVDDDKKKRCLLAYKDWMFSI